MSNNNTSIVTTGTDKEWHEIVNQIVGQLSEDSDLPEKVIEVTEYLLSGWPLAKVAKKTHVQSSTIRAWLTKYPAMAAAVGGGRKLLTKWRMARLEQQFLSAVDASQKVLEIDFDGTTPDGSKVDGKILPVIAAQARYIIGLFAGQKVDVEVRHELGDTVLKAQNDALNYLAAQLKQQRDTDEPIVTTFRVIDDKQDTTGPMIDENGDPPFGRLGVIDKTDAGILCHVCGNRFKNILKHIAVKHNLPTEEYELLYMLQEGSLRDMEGY